MLQQIVLEVMWEEHEQISEKLQILVIHLKSIQDILFSSSTSDTLIQYNIPVGVYEKLILTEKIV